jgi:hypothetical protein
MRVLFRAMKEASSGLVEVGATARTLGARPAIDVPAHDPTDLVYPGQGGMSVSPDDPMNLPYFRRPPRFRGTGKDPVWRIVEADLGPGLCFRPDATQPAHGFIEPSRPMSLAEYQEALEQTQMRWSRA